MRPEEVSAERIAKTQSSPPKMLSVQRWRPWAWEGNTAFQGILGCSRNPDAEGRRGRLAVTFRGRRSSPPFAPTPALGSGSQFLISLWAAVPSSRPYLTPKPTRVSTGTQLLFLALHTRAHTHTEATGCFECIDFPDTQDTRASSQHSNANDLKWNLRQILTSED